MIKITIYLQHNTITLLTKDEPYEKLNKELVKFFTSTTLQIIKLQNRNIIIPPSKIQAIEFERVEGDIKSEDIKDGDFKLEIQEDIISD
jgi:hypothetical protein